MLELTRVSKSFGGIEAVKNVSLTLGTEGITAIIGSNGAGKTTLLNLITGFLKPTSGEVRFSGSVVSGLPPHAIARVGLIRTFQIPSAFAGASVAEHIAVAASLRDSQRKRGEKSREGAWWTGLARRTLEKAGMAGHSFASVPVEQAGLAYWQLKVLQVAMALARAPAVLLLDEPAGGLSPGDASELATVIRLVANEGVRVCLVEHRIAFVMQLVERVVVMERGQILADGTPSEVRKDQRVIESYLGSEK